MMKLESLNIALNDSKIPEHMRDGVREYLENGVEPGDFLTAVLENNLVEAFGRADSINTAAMGDWADFLYNQMPVDAWGSPEKVERWCERRREARWNEADQHRQAVERYEAHKLADGRDV